MHVHLKNTVTAILGDTHVTGVILKDGVGPRLRSRRRRRGNPAECRCRGPRRAWKSIAASSSATTWRAVRRRDVYAVGECAQHRGRVYGLVAPVWEQVSVLADRLTGRNPRRAVPGIEHLDEVEGRRRRSRRDGRQGAGRGRRRGGQLRGAVARHLQEADRSQQPPRRRHRHGRRGDRARSDPGVSRSPGRWRTAGPSCSSPRSAATGAARAGSRFPTRRRSAIATRSARRRSSKPCWAALARCRRSAT